MDEKNNKQLNGILILNKPKGPSSNLCVEKIKKRFKQKKVGHAGTLDPIASGILIILLGQGTKLAPYLMEGYKVYRGIIQLGLETDTYDITGNIVSKASEIDLREEDIIQGIETWKGLIEQEVPPYSAAKHKGKPFYLLARRGENPPLKTKKIYIDHLEVLDINLPFVEFRVRCSKGTYIRSLAHSLGKRLKVGGVLKDLLREEVYPYALEDAVTLNELLDHPEMFSKVVVPISESLPHWPKVIVDGAVAHRVKNGNPIKTGEITRIFPGKPGERCFFLDPLSRPLALMETCLRDGELYWRILRGLWNRGFK